MEWEVRCCEPLIANVVLNSNCWLKAKLTNTHKKHHQVLKNGYGNRASYLIGIVHGIGAQTPAQMLLFALAINLLRKSNTHTPFPMEKGHLTLIAFILRHAVELPGVSQQELTIPHMHIYIYNNDKHPYKYIIKVETIK